MKTPLLIALLAVTTAGSALAEVHVLVATKVFERAAGQKKEVLLSSPKIVCLNGQAAGITMGESRLTSNQEILTGITLEVTPKISGTMIQLEGFYRERRPSAGNQPDGVMMFSSEEIFFDLKTEAGKPISLQKKRAGGGIVRIELTPTIRKPELTEKKKSPVTSDQ